MKTVFDFTLPRGYMDENNKVHKKGKMRLATAGDEISAVKDPRVKANPSYISIVILSNVITHLEGIEMVTADIIERLYTSDLAFLQNMYEKINNIEKPMIPVVCPECGRKFEIPLDFTQEV